MHSYISFTFDLIFMKLSLLFQVREYMLHQNGLDAAVTMELQPQFGVLESFYMIWFVEIFLLSKMSRFVELKLNFTDLELLPLNART